MIHYEDLQKLHKYGFFVLIFATTAMFFFSREKCSAALSKMLSRVWPFATPWTIYSPWNSPGQNTGVGSRSVLQGDLPNPGIEPMSRALQADSLPAKPRGKPKNTGVGSRSLL